MFWYKICNSRSFCKEKSYVSSNLLLWSFQYKHSAQKISILSKTMAVRKIGKIKQCISYHCIGLTRFTFPFVSSKKSQVPHLIYRKYRIVWDYRPDSPPPNTNTTVKRICGFYFNSTILSKIQLWRDMLLKFKPCCLFLLYKEHFNQFILWFISVL